MSHTGQPQNAAASRGSRVTLEILGTAGMAVAVFSQHGSNSPPRQIFEGTMPPSGQLRLRVPHLRLQISVDSASAGVDLRQEAATTQVDLRRPSGDAAP